MSSPSVYGDPNVFKKILTQLRQGKINKVVVLVGAGLSTSAGIPDFRSSDGLYAKLQAYELPYPEAMFSICYYRYMPMAFNTLMRWLWSDPHFDKNVVYKPTIGHAFLRMLDENNILQKVYTQNIDGFEAAAGLSEERNVECHGHLRTAHCAGPAPCGQAIPVTSVRAAIDDRAGFIDGVFNHSSMRIAMEETPELIHAALRILHSDSKPDYTEIPFTYSESLPKCPRCGSPAKPDIVFFGEDLPERFDRESESISQADLMIVVGSSLQVEPVASLSSAVNIPRILINRNIVGVFRDSLGDLVQERIQIDIADIEQSMAALTDPEIQIRVPGAPSLPLGEIDLEFDPNWSDTVVEQHLLQEIDRINPPKRRHYSALSAASGAATPNTEARTVTVHSRGPRGRSAGPHQDIFIEGDADESFRLLARLLGWEEQLTETNARIIRGIQAQANGAGAFIIDQKEFPDDMLPRQVGFGDLLERVRPVPLTGLDLEKAPTHVLNAATAAQIAQDGWYVVLIDSERLRPISSEVQEAYLTPMAHLCRTLQKLQLENDVEARTRAGLQACCLTCDEQDYGTRLVNIPAAQCLIEQKGSLVPTNVSCVAMSGLQLARFIKRTARDDMMFYDGPPDQVLTRLDVNAQLQNSWHLNNDELTTDYVLLSQRGDYLLNTSGAPGYANIWDRELANSVTVHEMALLVDFCTVIVSLEISYHSVCARLAQLDDIDDEQPVPLRSGFGGLGLTDISLLLEPQLSDSEANEIIQQYLIYARTAHSTQDSTDQGLVLAQMVQMAQEASSFLHTRYGLSRHAVEARLPEYMRQLLQLSDASTILTLKLRRASRTDIARALRTIYKLCNVPWYNGPTETPRHGCLVLTFPIISDSLRGHMENRIISSRKNEEVADVGAFSASFLVGLESEAQRWPHPENTSSAVRPLYRPPFGHWAASFFGYLQKSLESIRRERDAEQLSASNSTPPSYSASDATPQEAAEEEPAQPSEDPVSAAVQNDSETSDGYSVPPQLLEITSAERLAQSLREQSRGSCIFTRHLGLDSASPAEVRRCETEAPLCGQLCDVPRRENTLTLFFKPAGIQYQPYIRSSNPRFYRITCDTKSPWYNSTAAVIALRAELEPLLSSILGVNVEVTISSFDNGTSDRWPGLCSLSIQWESPCFYDVPIAVARGLQPLTNCLNQGVICMELGLDLPPLVSASESIILYIVRMVLESGTSILQLRPMPSSLRSEEAFKTLPWAVPDSLLVGDFGYCVAPYVALADRLRHNIAEAENLRTKDPNAMISLTESINGTVDPTGALIINADSIEDVVVSVPDALLTLLRSDSDVFPASDYVCYSPGMRADAAEMQRTQFTHQSLRHLCKKWMRQRRSPGDSSPQTIYNDLSGYTTTPVRGLTLFTAITAPLHVLQNQSVVQDGRAMTSITRITSGILNHANGLPVVYTEAVRDYQRENNLQEPLGLTISRRSFGRDTEQGNFRPIISYQGHMNLDRRFPRFTLLGQFLHIFNNSGSIRDQSTNEKIRQFSDLMYRLAHTFESEPRSQQMIQRPGPVGRGARYIPSLDTAIPYSGSPRTAGLDQRQKQVTQRAQVAAHHQVLGTIISSLALSTQQLQVIFANELRQTAPDVLRYLMDQSWVSYSSRLLHMLTAVRLISDLQGTVDQGYDPGIIHLLDPKQPLLL